jgi:GTP-binding protein EngB required for normal cell division
MDFCDANGISYQVIQTKTDKASKSEIKNQKSEILSAPRPAMSAEILETSAEKKIGIETLRKIIGVR